MAISTTQTRVARQLLTSAYLAKQNAAQIPADVLASLSAEFNTDGTPTAATLAKLPATPTWNQLVTAL